MKIMKINLFKKEEKYHWYQVKYIYKNKRNEEVFHYFKQIGVSDQRTILNHRKIKKIEFPLHKTNGGSLKKELKNGKFYVEFIAYLGYFPTKKQTVKNESKRKENQRSLWQQIQAIMPR